jgi:hypothetical protein
MKKLLLGALLLLSTTSFGQWTMDNVNNGFDEPYRICYSKPSDGVIMKLEEVEGNIVFYLANGYYCDEDIKVDISFLVAGSYKKYTITGNTSSNKKSLFLIWDLVNADFVTDFKNAGNVRIRVNESYCSSEIYEFSMNNSSKALEFIQGK